MRSEILEKHPAAQLQVYVVWFDMLAGDSREMVDLRVLGDPRVTNYWDEKKAVGRRFSDNVVRRPGITWDHYFLYGPEARWDATPGPLVSMGGSVIGASDGLRQSIRPFLGS